MADLEKGITREGKGYRDKAWNILGQRYYPQASCDAAFAFVAVMPRPIAWLAML